MSDMLKIRNWGRWQSYRGDRGQPPWIKLHRCLMKNAEWAILNDAQKGQLACMWLLAADREGEIPSDPAAIRKMAGTESDPDVALFQELGFIEKDAKVSPKRRQRGAVPRRQTDANTTLVTMVVPDLSLKKDLEERRSATPAEAVALSELLAGLIRERLPKARKPSIELWAKDIDKIHRIEHHDWEEIERVLRWSQQDGFWSGNILSGCTLRRQFDRLTLAMRRPAINGQPAHVRHGVGSHLPPEPPPVLITDAERARLADEARAARERMEREAHKQAPKGMP